MTAPEFRELEPLRLTSERQAVALEQIADLLATPVR